jgi:hypothetical protein
VADGLRSNEDACIDQFEGEGWIRSRPKAEPFCRAAARARRGCRRQPNLTNSYDNDRCKKAVEILGRARVIDVTPDSRTAPRVDGIATPHHRNQVGRAVGISRCQCCRHHSLTVASLDQVLGIEKRDCWWTAGRGQPRDRD